ncbi:unnamed protein product [Meloidogyne enterolobii]|uniref:Uncharacterized protein n=1 Tax=Meloidogyne enterolobii TaxID=390850 RepID=A0ACB1A8K7_MELEN
MLMNPKETDLYETKYNNLLEYYCHMEQMNNRLKHRLYHVRKEINHLKQLKRVLCERLLMHRAVIIDSNLEIPDNESSVSLKDNKGYGGDVNYILNNFGCFNFTVKTINNAETEMVNNTNGGATRKRKMPSKKENGGGEQGGSCNNGNVNSSRRSGGGGGGRDNKRRKARDEAKQNIISIIESIVSDTPKSEDSVKSEATTNEAESAHQELSDVPTPTEQNSGINYE